MVDYGDLSGKTVVVAFSGGLDTSYCAVYLREHHGAKVVTVTADAGGFGEQALQAIEARAHETGVERHLNVDVREEVYRGFIRPLIWGNVLRGGVYPISVAAERTAQAMAVARVARSVGAVAVVHGSTGAGNDQVRFDVALSVEVPGCAILAPIRDLSLSREEETRYLEEHGVRVDTATRDYSVNEGLWGTTIGGRETQGSWETVPDRVYVRTQDPASAPSQGRELVISFEHGLPCALDGESLEGVEAVECLNRIGGLHGVGRGVHLGETILGIKGRVAFEAPAPAILIPAHRELEKIVLTRWQSVLKDQLAATYGMLLHEALYHEPVMRDIEAFLEASQRAVRGDVRVRLCQGRVEVQGCRSPASLMEAGGARYGEGSTSWTGEEAAGFSRIYGTAARLAARAGGAQS